MASLRPQVSTTAPMIHPGLVFPARMECCSLSARRRMKKLGAFFLPFVLLLLTPLMSAGTSGPENKLKLIPEPKEARVQEGSFHVRQNTRILVEFGHQNKDHIT